MESSWKNFKGIGSIALEEMILALLKTIPVIGPVIETTWSMRARIKEYYEKQNQDQKVALNIINQLSLNEVKGIINAVLQSKEGIHVTQSLSESELRKLKIELMQIPNELDQIMNQIEVIEENERITDRNRRIESKKNTRDFKLNKLESDLKTNMKKRLYENAFESVKELNRMKPFNFSFWRVRFFIYKRVIAKDKVIVGGNYFIYTGASFLVATISFSIMGLISFFRHRELSYQSFGICTGIVFLGAFLSYRLLTKSVILSTIFFLISVIFLLAAMYVAYEYIFYDKTILL